MPRHQRVLGYARVSSAEQALGTSLQDQQEAISAYAKARGLEVTRFYVEAESAIHEKIERREQMRQLMRDARKGDLILCAKIDRWSRDPEFTYGSVRKILAAGASFFSIDERLDPSTSEGDTALGFRILYAREEHKRIKERLVGTRNLLRDRGYYAAGIPPMGYRRASPTGTKGLAKNVLVVVPEEAETVRRIFRMYVSGKSMAKVADELGLKLDRVKDALHNRTYLGEQKNSRGEWIKSRHDAIIDVALFARAQAVIDARRLGGSRQRTADSETRDWILRGVARCLGCGGKMGAAYAGPKGEGRRHYYYCTKRCQTNGNRSNTGAFVPVREVEANVTEFVLARLEEIRENVARGPESGEMPVDTRLPERRERLQRRRQRYLEAFADEHMSREELRAAMTKLDAESMKLDVEEAAQAKPSALSDPAVCRALLRDVKRIRQAWKAATPTDRRTIVEYLATEVRIAKNRAPAPVWRSIEELAAELHA